MGEAAEEAYLEFIMATPAAEPVEEKRDWHGQRDEDEPPCNQDQWRTRDREVVISFAKMRDSHVAHCIRFAKTKSQHRSRLVMLLAEQAYRETQKAS